MVSNLDLEILVKTIPEEIDTEVNITVAHLVRLSFLTQFKEHL